MIRTLFHSRRAVFHFFTLMLFAAILADAFVASACAAQVHYLPDVHSMSAQRSIPETDFRLHPYRVKGMGGKILDVPAHLLDIPSGAGGWISPEPNLVPAFPVLLPRNMRNRIQLFYSGEKGSPEMWLVVPRDWVIWNADNGADGSFSFQFIAASGLATGWMQVNGQGGCAGCMPEVVSGLGIPAAERALKDNEFFPLNAKLWPKPSALVHPDACAVLLTYKTGKNTIHGAILLYVDDSGQADGTESVYISLPDHESALGRFIAATFLKSRMQLNHFSCKAPVLR